MPDLSNIAKQHDADFSKFEVASLEAKRVVEIMQHKLDTNGYPDHQKSLVVEMLVRFEVDPEFFLERVPQGKTASIEVLLTDRGRHGMAGNLLPQEEARPLANALAERNRARTDMRANWSKMPLEEQAARTLP